jgi:hypothetical protein
MELQDPKFENLINKFGEGLFFIHTIYVNKTRTEFITSELEGEMPRIKTITYLDIDMSDNIWNNLFDYLEYDEDGDVSSFIDILEDIGVEVIEE